MNASRTPSLYARTKAWSSNCSAQERCSRGRSTNTNVILRRPLAQASGRLEGWRHAPSLRPSFETVARDQLKYAVAELSTHDNQRVTKALNDGLQAALTGTKTPEQALKDSQREAERILRPYRK